MTRGAGQPDDLLGRTGIETDAGNSSSIDEKSVTSHQPFGKPKVSGLKESGVHESPSPDERAHATSRRILVVEDVLVNQEVIAAMLQAIGHAVIVVDNGPAALALLNVDQFDLVLMDWHMPGEDGLETTRRLRQLEASRGSRRTPVVIVSASAFEHEVAACVAAGADSHLAKPYRMHELKDVVERWS